MGSTGEGNMKHTLLWIMIGATLLAVSGCGGSSEATGGLAPAPAGILSLVSDPADLEASIKAGLTKIQ
jgi:hypothetical protein